MGVKCRDVIDLAMFNLSKLEIAEATPKRKAACGEAILKDLLRVIDISGEESGLLECSAKAIDFSVSPGASLVVY